MKDKLRKKIIELIHGLPYEEAIKRELVMGCLLKYKDYRDKIQVIEKDGKGIWVREADKDNCFLKIERLSEEDYSYEVLGLPITIGRVMQALANKGFITNLLQNPYKEFQLMATETEYNEITYVGWELLKGNKEDCTLEDQPEETINKLCELFVINEKD